MYPDPASAVAEAHRAQLLREGRQGRLAALADCCRPSRLRQQTQALIASVQEWRQASKKHCCA